MKTETVVAWVVVLGFIMFGIWVVVVGTGAPGTEASILPHAEAAASVPKARASLRPTVSPYTEGKGTMEDLIALKKDFKCSVTTMESSPQRTGMVYVTGNTFRGDFVTVGAGKKVYTAMINDGKFLFAWTIGAKTGLSIPTGGTVHGGTITSHGGIDAKAVFEYECAAWTPVSKFFVPPPTVVFLDTAGNIRY